VDTEYVFHLVLKTSAGTYSSEKLRVKTHKMTDLSGITITPGHMPAALRESLQSTVERIGAKLVDTVRIDTTHFVCTEGRGAAWEKAVENNIPVVVPDWIKGCEREGRIVGVRGYYLNADPRLRQIGPGQAQPQAQQQQGSQQQRPRSPIISPTTRVTPPTPERPTREERTEESSTPPPPPPKDDEESGSSVEEQEAPEPKSTTGEQKVRTEDLKPGSSVANGKDDESSEEEEEGVNEKGVEAGLPVREKNAGELQPSVDDDDDGASFEDVKF